MESKKYTLTIVEDKLDNILMKKESELDNLISDFMLEHLKIKVDKQGNEINDTNPYLVSTYFFKGINPIENVNLNYDSEQLGKVYDLYSKIVERVNMEIMVFQPTISHFCKFAGISIEKFNEYKNGYDESMRVLISRINSDIFDANMTLTQHRRLNEKTTTYRMKVENEKIEKKTPNVNINITKKEPLDLDKINDRIYEIKSITKKQKFYEGE